MSDELPNTISYTLFDEPEYRPAAIMPLPDHIAVGQLISVAMNSPVTPKAARDTLDVVRVQLESWFCQEYEHLLTVRTSNSEFDAVDIYSDAANDDNPFTSSANTPEAVYNLLGTLRDKLEAAYPKCGPLTDQLLAISSASVTIGFPNL